MVSLLPTGREESQKGSERSPEQSRCAQGASSVGVTDAFRGKHGFEKKGPRSLFKEFAKEFLERYSKVNKRSWRSDVSIVNKLNPYFGDKYLEEIKPEEVEGFKSARLEEGEEIQRLTETCHY